MARIDDLLDRHSAALERLTDREARQFVQVYREAGRDLVAQIAQSYPTEDQEQRLRIMLAQVRQGRMDLERRLGTALDPAIQRAEVKALADLKTTIAMAEPLLGETAGAIEVAALRRLTGKRALALHTFSIQRYGSAVVSALQRDLVQSTAMGEGVDTLERRLRRTLKGQEHRAWLIARMELSRAYNDAEVAGIMEADQTLPGGMLKKIHETRDRRNHPFSRASHGATAKAQAAFKIPVADVLSAVAAMGKGSGGILWQRRGANYVGMNLPAHFGERGRIVPWRKEWGEPEAAEAKVEEEKLDGPVTFGKTKKLDPGEGSQVEILQGGKWAGFIDMDQEWSTGKWRSKSYTVNLKGGRSKVFKVTDNARVTLAEAKAWSKQELTGIVPKKKAPKKAPKKKAPKVPSALTYKEAKKELKAAEEAAKALGLDPHQYHTKQGGKLTRHGWIDLIARAEKSNTFLLKAMKDNPALDYSSFLATKKKEILELETGLAALERVDKSYRQAARLAPAKWQEAQRKKWGRKLLHKKPKFHQWETAEKARYERNFAHALRTFEPDQLRLLYADGERIISGEPGRAFASPGNRIWIEPEGRKKGYIKQVHKAAGGHVNMDLRELGNSYQQRTGVDTLSHELGHRLDGVLGGNGTTGAPWKSRPGYEDAPKIWKDAFGDPYKKAQTGGVQLLARAEKSSRYRWKGNFVNPYEGRIYMIDSEAKSAAARALDQKSGPVEFIAMANSYRASEAYDWRKVFRLADDLAVQEIRRGKVAPGKKPIWEQLFQANAYESRDRGRARTALRLYGQGHQDALEKLYGDGARLAQEIGESAAWRGPPTPAKDVDLTITAQLLRLKFGTPVEKTLSPTGALGRHLNKPVDVSKLRPVNPKLLEADDRRTLGGNRMMMEMDPTRH
jgi:hypothetical protein